MAGIYWFRRWGKLTFLVVALLLTGSFLWYSFELSKDLARQEKERMSLWADATHELISPDPNALSFPLQVIEGNSSIPVILTDASGRLINYRNIDSSNDEDFNRKVEHLRSTGNCIDIVFDANEIQHIYYEDSTLLKRLNRYPWIELAILIAFLVIAYISINASKKLEQNSLWVGLSKETAHQLGTPISSLIGWLEYLDTTDVNPDIVADMKRDVERLSVVSARFSKIGSRPALVVGDVNEALTNAVEYMRKRVASNISIELKPAAKHYMAAISESLIQWVLENLIKNAVDAIDGKGSITLSINQTKDDIVIEVADTGKGIARKNWKRVFKPGYTTKTRGWGLGLSLTKRIVEEYHGGKIEVAESIMSQGTKFRISLPAVKES